MQYENLLSYLSRVVEKNLRPGAAKRSNTNANLHVSLSISKYLGPDIRPELGFATGININRTYRSARTSTWASDR
jgi:hypothetical protein